VTVAERQCLQWEQAQRRATDLLGDGGVAQATRKLRQAKAEA
jgi:hypothetical protein